MGFQLSAFNCFVKEHQIFTPVLVFVISHLDCAENNGGGAVFDWAKPTSLVPKDRRIG